MKKRRKNLEIAPLCASVFVALLLGVFPLACPPDGYAAIVQFKYALFLLLCGGFCAAALLLRGFQAASGARPLENPGKVLMRQPLAVKLFLLYLVFTALSAVFSDYGGTLIGPLRKDGVLTIAIYVLFCVFLSKSFRPRKWMLFLLGASASVFCIIGTAQLLGANPFVLYPQGLNYYGSGVDYLGEYLGTTGNAAFSAAFMSAASGVLSMALIKCDFRGKRLLAVPLFLLVFLAFKTGVDAGVAALAAGLLLMLPVAVTDRRSLAGTLFVLSIVLAAAALARAVTFSDGEAALAPARLIYLAAAALAAGLGALVHKAKVFAEIPARRYRRGAIAAVLAAVCFAVVFLWFYNGRDSGVLFEASEILHGRADDAFGTSRVYIWRNVLGGVGENLLFGTGPDTLGYWAIDPFTRYSEELGILLVTGIDAAHNEYLQILACQGLLAFLCYLGALLSLAAGWFRAPENRASAVAGAGVLFYCVQAFFGISMPVTAPFLWAALAVLLSAADSSAAAARGRRADAGRKGADEEEQAKRSDKGERK